MGEGVLDDLTAGLALEGVVADGLGGAHGFFDIAFFEKWLSLGCAHAVVGMMGPDAGEEVGLEFEADGEAVVFDIRDASFLFVDVIGTAEEFLDVMTDLMGDDVGVGEVSTGFELTLHLPEKGGVEVDGFFGGEVEGAHAGIGDSAGAHAGHAIVVDHFGDAVLLATVFKDLGPFLFGGAFDGADEFVDFRLLGGLGFLGGLSGLALGDAAHALEEFGGVDLEDKDGDEGHDDHAESSAHGDRASASSAAAATAFHVLASSEFLPAHGYF